MTNINRRHYRIQKNCFSILIYLKPKPIVNCSRITKMLGIALMSFMSLNCMAQDLIARQAPSDKHLKDVKNVKISGRTITSMSADLQNPASDIYTDWKNSGVSSAAGHVPSNYSIDLRGFHMPTPSRQVTSNFGQRWGRQHAGLDIKVYIGDTIRSAFDGKVRITQYQASGYGYYVVIRHPNGLETVYGHLSKIIAKENQVVRAGEVIGLGGNTGRSTGSHLHFETRICGTAINPALLFDFPNQDVTGDTYVYRGGAISKSSSVASRNAKKVEADNEKRNANLAANAEETAEVPATQEETPVVAETPKASSSRQNKQKKQQQSASYKVKDGDTLYKIAQKHGTTVAKLCKLNGIKESAPIHKGQVIKCS